VTLNDFGIGECGGCNRSILLHLLWVPAEEGASGEMGSNHLRGRMGRVSITFSGLRSVWMIFSLLCR
jgi:hypothetical protein